MELDVKGFENIPLCLGHLCEEMTVLPGYLTLVNFFTSALGHQRVHPSPS